MGYDALPLLESLLAGRDLSEREADALLRALAEAEIDAGLVKLE